MFLWIAPISYGSYGMVMVMNASFNGMGKPLPAVAISVGRMAVIYVPLALVANYFLGVAGIFMAYAVANILTGAWSYAWARASVQSQCDRNSSRDRVVPAVDPTVQTYAAAADNTRRS